ncbi:24018_t:CDS:1, partial [Racocetra persica]
MSGFKVEEYFNNDDKELTNNPIDSPINTDCDKNISVKYKNSKFYFNTNSK